MRVDAPGQGDRVGGSDAVAIQSAADRTAVVDRNTRAKDTGTTRAIHAAAGATHTSGAAGAATQDTCRARIHCSAGKKNQSGPSAAAGTAKPGGARPSQRRPAPPVLVWLTLKVALAAASPSLAPPEPPPPPPPAAVPRTAKTAAACE